MNQLTNQNLHTLFASKTPQGHIDAMDKFNSAREPEKHVKYTVRSNSGFVFGVIVLRDELPDELAVILGFADAMELVWRDAA